MIALLFIPLALFAILVFVAASGGFGLSLDKSLKLSDVCGLMATTLVAVVLQYLVQRRGKATDSEKLMLTEQISSILTDLTRLRDLLLPLTAKSLPIEEATKVTQSFDSFGEGLSTLRFCIEKSHCKNLMAQYKWIEREFIDYKIAITGGNFPVTPISFISAAQGSGHRIRIDKDLRLLVFQIAKE